MSRVAVVSIDTLYDVLSWVVIVIAASGVVGTGWAWRLYFSDDNPAPRSRLLLVMCTVNTLVSVASIGFAVLAVIRLGGQSLGAIGGVILVVGVLILESVHLITVGYLWWLRRRRLQRNGKASPPPFSEFD